MFTEPFHSFLTRQRLATGLNQTEFANRLGMCAKRYSHLERGDGMPSETEIAFFSSRLGKCWGYTAPDGVGRRTADNGRRQRGDVDTFHPHQDRSSHLRFRAALREYPAFVKGVMASIRQRPDFADCQFHAGKTALESAEESMFLMLLIQAGALPAYYPPLWLGSLHHRIIDPSTHRPVGHSRFPCWAFSGDFYFFQVTLATTPYHRVDVLRWNGTWTVIEVDGVGHNSNRDAERTLAIGLPTTRLTPAQIVGEGFQFKAA